MDKEKVEGVAFDLTAKVILAKDAGIWTLSQHAKLSQTFCIVELKVLLHYGE